jgi:hypothetical protein
MAITRGILDSFLKDLIMSSERSTPSVAASGQLLVIDDQLISQCLFKALRSPRWQDKVTVAPKRLGEMREREERQGMNRRKKQEGIRNETAGTQIK